MAAISLRYSRRDVNKTMLFAAVSIAVLGAAFKPESDDVRDSPALNVAGMLQLNGATVNVYDPKAMDNSRTVFPTLTYATSAVEACDRADAVLVLTEWPEFVGLDPAALADTVRATLRAV